MSKKQKINDFRIPDIKELLIKKTNKIVALASAGITLLSIGIICLAVFCKAIDSKIANFLTTIASTFLSISSISLIWELFVKRSYTSELYAKMDLKSNILATGIVQVETNFHRIHLDAYLNNTKNATIVVLWGASLFENEEYFNAICNLEELNIIITDKENADTLHTLENRYKYFDEKSGYNVNKIIKQITSTETQIKRLKEKIPKVNLYLNDVPLLASYYLLGDYSIMTTFNHTQKSKGIATFVSQKGASMYDYVSQEVNSILDHAKIYTDGRSIKNEK